MNLNELVMSKEIDEHTFGRFVRERREALGMSVRGLAAKLNMTPAYLSDIEKGNRYAPTKYLDELREALQIPDDEKGAFQDLASATRGFLFEDINPYLGKQPLARVALRKAQDMDLPDEVWMSFIEEMDRMEEEQMRLLNVED